MVLPEEFGRRRPYPTGVVQARVAWLLVPTVVAVDALSPASAQSSQPTSPDVLDEHIVTARVETIARSMSKVAVTIVALVLCACGGGGVGGGGGQEVDGPIDNSDIDDPTYSFPSPTDLLTQIPCESHVYCREVTIYPVADNARPGTTETLAPIASSYTGRTYDVTVHLPATYHESTRLFSVIYSLDGDRFFLERANEIDRQQKEVVLVSIHAENKDSRYRDYTYYDHNGQRLSGQDFYNYIVFELIPFVEASFRIDGNRRALEGWSHGGSFVVYSMFTDRLGSQYFKTFVAQEPSIWIHEESLNDLKTRLRRRFSALDIEIYLSSSLPGNPSVSNGGVTGALYNYFVSASFENLDIQYYSYDLGHGAMNGPAFADFLHDHY